MGSQKWQLPGCGKLVIGVLIERLGIDEKTGSELTILSSV